MNNWAGYLRFRDVFAEVLDPRLYTLDWLDKQVLELRVMLWAGRDAAIIAQFKPYPTGACDIEGLLAAGDLDEIVSELIPIAERFGKAMGCIGAIVQSREGWGRALRDSGYRTYQVGLRKEL